MDPGRHLVWASIFIQSTNEARFVENISWNSVMDSAQHRIDKPGPVAEAT